MNFVFLTTLTMLPLIAISQRAPSSSVCSEAGAGDNVVLTICTHESGMVVLPQPRLYLRLFADGRGEYEANPPFIAGAGEANHVLVKKEFRITLEEMQEIQGLGRSADLQNAKGTYPIFRSGTDSSLETTLTFDDQGGMKKIILRNFSTQDHENKKHYPASLIALMEHAEEFRERAIGIVRPIPSITFCELIKNREWYIGKKVSIHADLEYPKALPLLRDPECASAAMGALQTTESIGVGYSGEGSELDGLKNKVLSIRDSRFGGRARVFVTGILRDETKRALDGYNYRFVISEFRSIEPIVLPYQGSLEPGWMYADTFDHITAKGLVLSSLLKMPMHHAARLEWINQDKFSALTTSGRKHIVFRVVSRDIQKMGNNRWNSTYTCEILELK